MPAFVAMPPTSFTYKMNSKLKIERRKVLMPFAFHTMLTHQ
jgi:hypothetical protein